jgi:hypothetical protein
MELNTWSNFSKTYLTTTNTCVCHFLPSLVILVQKKSMDRKYLTYVSIVTNLQALSFRSKLQKRAEDKHSGDVDLTDYSVFGLHPLSGILKNTFRKLELFPSSGEKMARSYSVQYVKKG